MVILHAGFSKENPIKSTLERATNSIPIEATSYNHIRDKVAAGIPLRDFGIVGI